MHTGKQNTRKTLTSVTENLVGVVSKFNDIVEVTELLIRKMERTEGIPQKTEAFIDDNINATPLPIIELLDGTYHRLEGIREKALMNLEHLHNMID